MPKASGALLLYEFLASPRLARRELASALHTSYQRGYELVRGRRWMTPTTALRLERLLCMSAGLSMNLQWRWVLYQAQ